MPAVIDEHTQFIDPATSKPIVAGKLYIGTQGLDPKTNLITIFSDRGLTSALANPQTLDSSGRTTAKIWLEGSYSFQVDDAADVQKYQSLDAGGISSGGTAETMADLLSTATAFDNVSLLGFHSSGDGGGGQFYYDSTQDRANHNGGTIIDPTNTADLATWNAAAKAAWFTAGSGTGCWMRLTPGYVRPEMFGADLVNDTDSIINAIALSSSAKIPIDGANITYLVFGNVSLLADTHLRNIKFQQQTPDAAGDVRTLTSSSVNNITLENVTVDRNGDGTNGQPALDYGIYIDGGSGHYLVDVEVFGDDIGGGLYLDGCTDFIVNSPYVHDINYSFGSDPGQDQINALRFNDCSDFLCVGARVNTIGGNFGAGPTTQYSRGITVGGCSRFSITGYKVYDVGQGVDLTGSVGNKNFSISDGYAYQCYTHGLKIANGNAEGVITNCLSERCDRIGFVVSGPGEAGTPNPENITFVNCKAKDIGYAGNNTNETGFRVEQGSFLLTYPRGIKFIGCEAIDEQVTPTMLYGFQNDIAATGADHDYNEAINCRVRGAVTQAFSGFNAPSVFSTNTAAFTHNSTGNWLAMTWDEDQFDNGEMHDTASNTELFTARRAGTYQVNCTIAWTANASGERRVRLLKNGLSIARQIEDHKPNAGASTQVFNNISAIVELDEDDTLEVEVYQNSGGNLDVTNTRSFIQIYEAFSYNTDN